MREKAKKVTCRTHKSFGRAAEIDRKSVESILILYEIPHEKMSVRSHHHQQLLRVSDTLWAVKKTYNIKIARLLVFDEAPIEPLESALETNRA